MCCAAGCSIQRLFYWRSEFTNILFGSWQLCLVLMFVHALLSVSSISSHPLQLFVPALLKCVLDEHIYSNCGEAVSEFCRSSEQSVYLCVVCYYHDYFKESLPFNKYKQKLEHKYHITSFYAVGMVILYRHYKKSALF